MSSNGQDSVRARRLTKELHRFLNGSRKILATADAKLFLEALLIEVNPRRCVETLFSSKARLDPIRESVRADVSRDFIQNHSLRLVEYISDPGVRALADGAFLNDMIMAITYPPTFWNAAVKLCQNNGLSEKSLQQFSWLSYNLLCIPHEESLDCLADVQSIIKNFTTATNHKTRSNGYKIEKILQAKSSSNSTGLTFSPGGRHDNDFEDFRKIRIYPTTDEFLSTKQPYYLRTKEVEETPDSNRTMAHLDNQFRLLREDMLGELRTGLQVALGKKKGRSLNISLGNLSIAGLNMDGEQPCLALHCGLGLERLTKLDMTVRKKFLMDSKNFLKHESFGALLGDNDIHSFAHVNRDIDHLLREPPIVLLQFPDDESFKRALVALKTFRNLRFTLVNTPVFAYQPILESLKKRVEVPIDQNLLFLASDDKTFQPLPAQKFMTDKIIAERTDDGNVTIRMNGRNIELDESQARSVTNSLINPLTVIRGPPGKFIMFLR
jgi:hypothetical protein